jgi:NADH-quinone oxidoreductase subunit D
MAYGFTGPNLRAAGVDYDACSVFSYEDFDFIIPGKSGDTYDRFVFVMLKFGRVEYIRQALEKKGMNFMLMFLIITFLQRRCLHSMESLIYHFKIVMGEVPVPVAEIYHPVEGGNGELGFI